MTRTPVMKVGIPGWNSGLESWNFVGILGWNSTEILGMSHLSMTWTPMMVGIPWEFRAGILVGILWEFQAGILEFLGIPGRNSMEIPGMSHLSMTCTPMMKVGIPWEFRAGILVGILWEFQAGILEFLGIPGRNSMEIPGMSHLSMTCTPMMKVGIPWEFRAGILEFCGNSGLKFWNSVGIPGWNSGLEFCNFVGIPGWSCGISVGIPGTNSLGMSHLSMTWTPVMKVGIPGWNSGLESWNFVGILGWNSTEILGMSHLSMTWTPMMVGIPWEFRAGILEFLGNSRLEFRAGIPWKFWECLTCP
ncbi:hypothetical protein HGM15179_020926 [Zosterops borbonicus]|uniref:Uncharacterized protein n=1 Tax=Zosterops borbonicus TaxID=364589 RepID=A0A8K1D5G0_9PASS|nr:hypothetical protein HGM15179_021890 [Zosterops borbonicus]TRZ06180.1 hypothetical protein HGM15179_020926 [Zosterops borbonicus]